MDSTDYHDYVFLDGKLIGDFENMYLNSSEVPWHQNRTAYFIPDTIFLELISYYLQNSTPLLNICEIGCGLGYFTNRVHIRQRVGTTGYDISKTAITRAQEKFSDITFKQLDIRKECGGRFNCVIVKEILWYVFPELETVLGNIGAMLKDNGILCIAQTFPLNKDFVGRETIHDPEHLRDIFSNYFDLEYYSTFTHISASVHKGAHLVYRKKQ